MKLLDEIADRNAEMKNITKNEKEDKSNDE